MLNREAVDDAIMVANDMLIKTKSIYQHIQISEVIKQDAMESIDEMFLEVNNLTGQLSNITRYLDERSIIHDLAPKKTSDNVQSQA